MLTPPGVRPLKRAGCPPGAGSRCPDARTRRGKRHACRHFARSTSRRSLSRCARRCDARGPMPAAATATPPTGARRATRPSGSGPSRQTALRLRPGGAAGSGRRSRRCCARRCVVRRAARLRPALVQRRGAAPDRRPAGAGRRARGRADGASRREALADDEDRGRAGPRCRSRTAGPRSSATRSSTSCAPGSRGRDRLRAVQVVPGHARADPGVPLAPARPDRGRRARRSTWSSRRSSPRTSCATPRSGSGSCTSSGRPTSSTAPSSGSSASRPRIGRCAGRCRSSTASRSARRRASSRPRATSPGRLERSTGLVAEVLPHPPQELDYRDDGHGDFVLSVNRLDRAKRIDLLIEAAAARAVAPGRRSPATARTEHGCEQLARDARGRRPGAVRRPGPARGARRSLRDLLRDLLRAGRRGLRPGPVRVVPLGQARDHGDRCRRAARGRPRRLDGARRRPRSRLRSPRPPCGCATTPTRRWPSAGRARRSPPRSRGIAPIGRLLS